MYYAGAFCDEAFAAEFTDRSNPWFILFMKEDWFVEMVRERWTELNAEGSLRACIAEEREFITEYEDDLTVTFSKAAKNARSILNWIEKRMNWLDEEWLLTE